MGFPYRLLCDTTRDLGVKYGAADDPEQKTARRISYLIAPDGTVKQVWAKVDTKTHAEDVLQEIR
jgi:thioredoxin-dependent peroxiredoxin